jgi:hypothetical protein
MEHPDLDSSAVFSRGISWSFYTVRKDNCPKKGLRKPEPDGMGKYDYQTHFPSHPGLL